MAVNKLLKWICISIILIISLVSITSLGDPGKPVGILEKYKIDVTLNDSSFNVDVPQEVLDDLLVITYNGIEINFDTLLDLCEVYIAVVGEVTFNFNEYEVTIKPKTI